MVKYLTQVFIIFIPCPAYAEFGFSNQGIVIPIGHSTGTEFSQTRHRVRVDESDL